MAVKIPPNKNCHTQNRFNETLPCFHLDISHFHFLFLTIKMIYGVQKPMLTPINKPINNTKLVIFDRTEK